MHLRPRPARRRARPAASTPGAAGRQGLIAGLANGRFIAHPVAMAHGTVKFFKPKKGWGAISSPALPDGLDAWVHFSAIEGDGFRALEAGDRVDFEYEAVTQDSFRFRVTRVRKL
jgi:cold shock protein